MIFLDDLHRADAASLDALHALATDPDGKHVLLVGAFRPREVGAGHPLAKFEAELRRDRMPVSRIDLAPLSEMAVKDLLCDALGSPPDRVAALAELLTRKTAGNPFFLRRLIGTLHRAGLLAFDLRERKWSWRIAQIERVGITENVVELLLEAIRRLPEETRDSLPVAACVGNDVSLSVLTSITSRDEPELRAALEPAFREGLLVADAAAGNCHFAHERVQQAAYSVLSDAAAKRSHLRIGRLLASRSAARDEDAIFEATDHMNLGAGTLTADERLDLARMNHRAGLEAKASTAFGPALAYMRAGLSIAAGRRVGDGGRSGHPPDSRRGRMRVSDGRLRALRRARRGRPRARDLAAPEARSPQPPVVSATARAAWPEALDQGRRALAELGYALPSSYDRRDLEPAIAAEERAVDALLRGACRRSSSLSRS